MHKFQQATQSKLQFTKDPYLVAYTTLGEHRSIEIVIEFTLFNALNVLKLMLSLISLKCIIYFLGKNIKLFCFS